MKYTGRILYYFPIIHNQADMGVMSKIVRNLTIKQAGIEGLKRKMDFISRLWDEIEDSIRRMDLDYEKVRLYQDGLPICGREEEIVNEVAAAESRNYRLLQELIRKGARLMGTESSSLLMEEYKLIKKSMASDRDSSGQQLKETLDQLLSLRDRFIAARINNTLLKGETGIVFLGVMHSLNDLLDRDIKVIYPVSKLSVHG